ncbi:hypothetical protein TrCOL_g11294 [Triparma columacea]|uniref:Aminotransferase class I/classII large domain-containing protein n=1 Tax=Triparma columacea TaxID=722753 RepID=A0A9W7FW70_9STRA|nr:hypothetical protein TrCOL_g11294 [Triparma columacea]
MLRSLTRLKANGYPFTSVSMARVPSPIRALQPYVNQPGMISLGGGMPNASTFPISSIELKLKTGAGSSSLVLNEDETRVALQYSSSRGIPSLVSHLKALQQDVHKVTFTDGSRDIIVTTGSQDGLAKAFEMLLEPFHDTLLIENPTYSGSLAFLTPLGVNLKGVETDAEGMIPSKLRDVLDNWEDENGGRKKPRVVYTIPTGSNPTGGSLTFERKSEIYDICVEHDILILEDDPYYYLDFRTFDGECQGEEDAFLSRERACSFLNIDEKGGGGRVIRFDSFSKLLSSGIRVGFATGPTELIERIELHTQATMLHASGLSQAVVSKLFDDWGTCGFLTHVDDVAKFYMDRRDTFVACIEKHLEGLVEYRIPTAGMFVWMKLIGISDAQSLAMRGAAEKNVLVVPGSSFVPNEAYQGDERRLTTKSDGEFVRLSFSSATPDDMDSACRRLRELLMERRDN